MIRATRCGRRGAGPGCSAAGCRQGPAAVPPAAQADRDLDAVTTLFDIADDYVAHTPGATVRGLVDHSARCSFAPPEREPLIEPDTVAVVSAHAALGREWDFVVIAGLQEGLWPNTVPRGGVLGTQQLVDVLDGVGDTVSRRAPVLADERRLLVSAMGRARRRLLITAVDSDSRRHGRAVGVRRRADAAGRRSSARQQCPRAAPRVLAPAALVGRLRSVVCAPAGAVDEGRRRRAATQLARLAAAGVPGADPATWYGRTPVSTDQPLTEQRRPARHALAVDRADDRRLPAALAARAPRRHRRARPALGARVGGARADRSDGHDGDSSCSTELEKVWDALPFDSQWYSRNELARHRAMLSAFCQWRAQTRHELTEVGTEVDVDGVLTSPHPNLPDVRVRGRIDRLERDGAGRLVVVDVKTGKTPATKDDAQRHAQLAMYQLAVAAGLLARWRTARRRAARLPRQAGHRRTRSGRVDPRQPQREWQQTVHRAAAATAGPAFLARVNDSCGHCPVRSSCPAQEAPACGGEARS